jgi:hypothetical protein
LLSTLFIELVHSNLVVYPAKTSLHIIIIESIYANLNFIN